LDGRIDPTARIYSWVRVGEGTTIGEFSVIGKPFRLVHGVEEDAGGLTVLGTQCQIGCHVVIGRGTVVGDDCVIDNGTRIESDVTLGSECLVLYGGQICNDARLGNRCIIGGFVCERAVLGGNCRVFGKLVHKQLDPTNGWDDAVEPSPTLEDDVFVGFDALAIGPVVVGRNAYICAGAIITKNVPAYSVAYGINRIVDRRDWKGPLSGSPFFIKGKR